jgi:hypothetical protein
LFFKRNTSKKNQGNDSHYGLSCAKPDMQESEVNFLIDKQIKLLNVSFDEQKIIQKNNWSLFTLTTSGIFAFFLARQPQGSSKMVSHNSNLVQMNFPYPLVILRHFHDLDATLKHNKKKKGICTRFEWWETI